MTEGWAIRRNDGEFVSSYRRSRHGAPVIEWSADDPMVFAAKDEAVKLHSVLGGQISPDAEPTGETRVVAVVKVGAEWVPR